MRRVILTALAPALLLLATLDGQTPERAQTEAQARRATSRLQTLQREAEALAIQEKSLLVELRKLELERTIQTEKLRKIDADLDGVARQIGETTTRIEALEQQKQTRLPVLEARLVELYKLGSGGYVRMLLGVNDLRQIGRAYRTVAAMAELDRRRIEEHREMVAALKAERSRLERRRGTMLALQREARATRALADRATKNQAALVDQIDARRDLTAQLASELQAAHEKLQQTLAAVAAGGKAEPVVLPLRAFQRELEWPTPGRVTARFGRRTPGGATSSPNGIEIAAQDGEAVHAVHEGTVAVAEPFTGYGNLVIVDHGDQAYSLYGYLSAIDITPGARVDSGELLGSVGRAPTGGSVLYFELRIDGKPVDPVEWLKRR